jgi:YhcH/YjgK/YiaL family protein
MIIDKTDNIYKYTSLGEKFQKAFSFITDPELLFLEPGRYEIDGEEVYALINEYVTKDKSEGQLEAHKKYIDVQYVAKGEELIAYAPSDGQKILSDYNEIKDVSFLEGGKSFIKIEQGMFAVFFPDELHMPGIKTVNNKSVKKVVVKIKA